METNGVAIQEPRSLTERLTPAQIKADANLILQVMEAVMKDGVDYGTIPGCGDKRTLLKPGSEKLMMTFRLASKPLIQDLSNADEIRYQVVTEIVHAPSGTIVGYGVGEASSNEDKYKWRKVVSPAEWEATPEDRRRTKFAREYTAQQVRTNPADIANTVLKMADKRSVISGILKATAASSIFTQDLEDLSEDMRQAVAEAEPGAMPEPIATPQPKASPSMAQTSAQATVPTVASPRPAKERMRPMECKFDSKCRACTKKISQGERIYYDGDTKSAYHEACA